jgi:hypothetical protein
MKKTSQHDLQNTFAAIALYGELIEQAGIADSHETIVSHARHIGLLVKDLSKKIGHD